MIKAQIKKDKKIIDLLSKILDKLPPKEVRRISPEIFALCQVLKSI